MGTGRADFTKNQPCGEPQHPAVLPGGEGDLLPSAGAVFRRFLRGIERLTPNSHSNVGEIFPHIVRNTDYMDSRSDQHLAVNIILREIKPLAPTGKGLYEVFLGRKT